MAVVVAIGHFIPSTAALVNRLSDWKRPTSPIWNKFFISTASLDNLVGRDAAIRAMNCFL